MVGARHEPRPLRFSPPAGLIWFVQTVHYPLFAAVGPERFAEYERAHASRTAPVVGPPMLIEAATALALPVVPLPHVSPVAPWLGLAVLVLIWLSTFFVQVPRHRELASGFEAGSHRRLVVTNWVRTVAWSARAVLGLWMMVRLGQGTFR